MAPPPLSGEEIIPLLTLILIPWCFHESGDGKGNRIVPTGPGLLPTQQMLLTSQVFISTHVSVEQGGMYFYNTLFQSIHSHSFP